MKDNTLFEGMMSGIFLYCTAHPCIKYHFDQLTRNKYKTSYMVGDTSDHLYVEDGSQKYDVVLYKNATGAINNIKVA